ncbi:unnamed protein product, partial [Tilletia laevis]
MTSESNEMRELVPGHPECRLMSHVLNRPEKVNAFTISLLRCVVQVVIARLAADSLDRASTEEGEDATTADAPSPNHSPRFETSLYDTLEK